MTDRPDKPKKPEGDVLGLPARHNDLCFPISPDVLLGIAIGLFLSVILRNINLASDAKA